VALTALFQSSAKLTWIGLQNTSTNAEYFTKLQNWRTGQSNMVVGEAQLGYHERMPILV
jgi:hypothetical protein